MEPDYCAYFDEPVGLVRVKATVAGYEPIPPDQYEFFHKQSDGKDGRELAKWINATLGLSPKQVDKIISASMNLK